MKGSENMDISFDNLISKARSGDDPLHQYIDNVDDESLINQYYLHIGSFSVFQTLPNIYCNLLNNNYPYLLVVKDSLGIMKSAFICINLLGHFTNKNHVAIPAYAYNIMFDKLYASIYKLNDVNLKFVMNAFENNSKVKRHLWYQTLIVYGLYDCELTYNYGLCLKNDKYVSICSSATSYKRNGEYDKAIELLNQAIELQPYSGIAYYNIGKIYFIAGQYDKSITSYSYAYLLGTGGVIDPKQILLHMGYSLLVKNDHKMLRKDGIKYYTMTMDPFHCMDIPRTFSNANTAYRNYLKTDEMAKIAANEYVLSGNKSAFNLRDARSNESLKDYSLYEDLTFDNISKNIDPISIKHIHYDISNEEIGKEIFDCSDIEISVYNDNHIVVSH